MIRLMLAILLALALLSYGGAPIGRIAFVERSLWAKRGQASHDFLPAAIVADAQGKGNGRPSVRMLVWGGRDAISLAYHNLGKGRGQSSVRVDDLANGKGKRFQIGSSIEFEARASVAFPDGSLYAPESGCMVTTLTLDAPPAGLKAGGTQEWEFDLALPDGAEAAYQGDLTAFEIEEMHATRPAWCVGSYAIYAADGRKLAHLVRPFLADSAGNWTWATGTYAKGVYTVAAPADWLLAAQYPVRLDPTFGYTTVGGTKGTFNRKYVTTTGSYSPATNGTTASIQWYVHQLDSSARVTFGLYSDSAGAPGARIVDTAEGTPPASADWLVLNTDTAATISTSTTYWIACATNAANVTEVWYDAATGSVRYTADGIPYVAGSVPDPCPATALSSGYQYSAYLTYTAAPTGRPWRPAFAPYSGGYR